MCIYYAVLSSHGFKQYQSLSAYSDSVSAATSRRRIFAPTPSDDDSLTSKGRRFKRIVAALGLMFDIMPIVPMPPSGEPDDEIVPGDSVDEAGDEDATVDVRLIRALAVVVSTIESDDDEASVRSTDDDEGGDTDEVNCGCCCVLDVTAANCAAIGGDAATVTTARIDGPGFSMWRRNSSISVFSSRMRSVLRRMCRDCRFCTDSTHRSCAEKRGGEVVREI